MRPEKVWFVYLIQCADRSLYCGISTDVGKRLAAHSRTPVELLATSSALTRSDALKLEYRIKKMPAGSKRAILEKQTAEDPRLS